MSAVPPAMPAASEVRVIERVRKSVLAALAGVVALAALAAPAAAQLFLYEPVFQSGDVEAADPLVGIAMPGATPAEQRAGLLWNLRSGLNVAALQCQFAPSLRTVDNYNALLAHHSRELADAYQVLEAYFRRVHRAQGPRRFDDYSTQTYNNFASLQAQLGFCQTAAKIGREALFRRKGELHRVAAGRMRELRASLVPAQDSFAFLRMPVTLAPINLVQDCTRIAARRERRQCEREQRGGRR